MIRKVLQYPDPLLRQLCEPIIDVADAASLIADLFDTMYDAPGRGMAAPQIGVSKRVLVADTGWKEGESTPVSMINPEVLWGSPETQSNVETCLSVPDQPREIVRPMRIEAMWLNEDGSQHRGSFDGMQAAAILHEMDHLNGRLVIDYEPAS